MDNLQLENQQVFISYDHRDRDWVENTLLPKLNEVHLSFRHDSEIHLGTSIYEWIDKSRRECKAFIIVISRSYIQNRSYARAEMIDIITRSLKGRLLVIPIFKEPVHEDELPFGIMSLNSIIDLNLLDSKLEQLARQLKGESNPLLPGGMPVNNHFVSPERRIRIQASTVCTQNCPWCHWDDFPKGDDVIPNYYLVSKLMIQLKEAGNLDKVTYPRPNIYFALTGGEPLANRNDDNNNMDWKYLASIDPLHTFLLTNGRLLDDQAISFIRLKGLKQIRIDLPIDSLEDFRGISTTMQESIAVYYIEVINRIGALLNSEAEVDVRFNYVITENNVEQIDRFLNFIQLSFHEHIGIKVKGVAFIEQHPRSDPNLNIFKLAEEWATNWHLSLNYNPLIPRKKTTTTDNGMLIEFTKLNCAVTEDIIYRCFLCVQEQDIAISADGRIRICSGWDPEKEIGCRYIFTHFEKSQPLVGISGAIRRRYGIAGFYSHFGIISNILSGKPIPDSLKKTECKYNPENFKNFLNQCGINISLNNLQELDFVQSLANNILSELSPFRRLYEEGTFNQRCLKNSTLLCCFLLRAVYTLIEKKDLNLRTKLNGILLLLEYLCVDENLFSNGRTLMVQGMSTDLLKEVSQSGFTQNFLLDSSYCLAAVAFENCEADVVLRFLNSQIPDSEIQKSAWVQYLVGCLYRQVGQDENAIKALELAYSLSDDQIKLRVYSNFSMLMNEVRVESKRSLGAIRKTRPGEFAQAQKDFALANFLSSIDNTRLRYASLLSDGYASMLQYFRNKLTEPYLQEAFKAHRDFNEAIALNPTFYACLIRMGLLELALGQTKIAIERLKLAKRSFSKRGLLTDQEYLNSILCDLIFIVADESPAPERPLIWSLGINDCKNVGKKDVLCVKEDAEFLLLWVNEHCESLKRQKLKNFHIDDDIKIFIEGCNKLIG